MGRLLQLVAACCVTQALLLVGATAAEAGRPAWAAATPSAPKRNCVYSAHRIDTLRSFGRLVGRQPTCALVSNVAAPDWRSWERPWYATHVDPNLNWARWRARDARHRELILTQSLIPDAVKGGAWRSAGARGRYARHARALARNLVAAGLGNSVLRLSHEANAVWNRDTVGHGARQMRLWKLFWRRTVKAMRSVPGARFRFDLTVNAAVRPIPLHRFYPGDDVVDIIGVDAYDAGLVIPHDRWRQIYSRPLGVRDVAEFARRHGKPLSIPEWGIGPAGSRSLLSGGDNVRYVRGIATVMRTRRTAYQAYFFNHEWAAQLRRSPRSLRVYRRAFTGRVVR